MRDTIRVVCCCGLGVPKRIINSSTLYVYTNQLVPLHMLGRYVVVCFAFGTLSLCHFGSFQLAFHFVVHNRALIFPVLHTRGEPRKQINWLGILIRLHK